MDEMIEIVEHFEHREVGKKTNIDEKRITSQSAENKDSIEIEDRLVVEFFINE